MSEVPILGSFWTLAEGTAPTGPDVCAADIRTRIETAARAGFTGMGFWHTDIAAYTNFQSRRFCDYTRQVGNRTLTV